MSVYGNTIHNIIAGLEKSFKINLYYFLSLQISLRKVVMTYLELKHGFVIFTACVRVRACVDELVRACFATNYC